MNMPEQVDTANLDAALAYAARGWPVVPLHTPKDDAACDCNKRGCEAIGKHPRTRHGLKDATTDEVKIRRWWEMWPHANVGVRTGEIRPGHYLSVIDEDPRAGGDESRAAVETAHGPIPDTMRALTGGRGVHYIFEGPAPMKTTSGALGPGLDTRGGGGGFGGGYIVAPPSLHASGTRYAWDVGAPTAPVAPPPWLLAAVNGPSTRARPSADAPADPGERIVDGQAGGPGRKKTLHSIGRTMRARGLDADEIFAAIRVINERRCEPPLDEKDVRRVAENAAKVPPGRSAEFEAAQATPTARRGLRLVEPEPESVPATPEEPDAEQPADEPNEAETGGGDGGGGNEGGGDGPPPRPPDWWGGVPLSLNRNGALRNTFANTCAVLRYAPEYRDRLTFDEMSLRPSLDGAALDEADVGRTRERIELEHGFSPETGNLQLALLTVARARTTHPVRAYLESLTWDGAPRIARLLEQVLRIKAPTALDHAMLRCWLISAVARVFEPGCKVDTCLVLVGPQGARKSTFFQVLASRAWFSDSHMDLSNKDAFMQLTATWITEWSEVESMTSSRQAGDIKKFVTSPFDTFRPPFARTVQRIPRAGVIVGTTNEDHFLNDDTGSRRFWVLRVREEIDHARLSEWRDQVWAEAVAAYRDKERWWLESAEEVTRASAAEEYAIAEPWLARIQRWMVENTRANYAIDQLMSEALRLEPRDMHVGSERRVGRCLRSLGFSRTRVRIGQGDAASKQFAWVWVLKDPP